VFDVDIASHYALGLEGDRLFIDGRPRLELVRTMELLERFLPPPPARIVDVGGGTGVYAALLAARGYEVRLIDPIELHVAEATRAAHEGGLANMSARLGDARQLDEPDRDADAVLLLGPLYHLTERADRLRALTEATRVLRAGGVMCAVGISRFASLLDGLKRRALSDPEFRAIVERDLFDGQHRNPMGEERPEHFTTAFFHRPEELEREARDAGFEHVELFAIEGPGWMVENVDDCDNQLFAARAVESERTLMSASSHIMVVGRASQATPPGAQ